MGKKIESEVHLSDKQGFETLDNIAQANHFNEWMYKTISEGMEGEVLEIGSGIGNISDYFVKDKFQISLSDMRREYCDFLSEKYGKNCKNVYQIDIVDPEFDQKHSDLFGTFDSVFALNIIEHVEYDDLAIKNCLKLLKNGGRLVILVPAIKFLFNEFDRGLGHYRRYNRKELEQLYLQNNIQLLKSRYFNFAGVLGWYVSGNILKKKAIPSGQMKLYNSLVWAFKIADFITRPFAGLSVIAFGIKK